MVTLGIY